ncbi:lycopene cyclase [Flavobacterium sp. MAH-1]|uniref:Lycopene cyclase n=1 Tax=Flavobacterium agri TaxID=2743471 RepID=A0A7Y9C816_9FLAO|nr:lycopene cyclase family protein [Flavobacterium agri]NUY81933.1 lycopene cyclase [Flavobacterium agri]NYA71957.1 lycopene cyclase [Flavobacterium agri]
MVFDYIFCGYGLSSQLLLVAMADAGSLTGKNVLILDDGRNEPRTWCFWESESSRLDGLVSRRWASAVFKSGSETEILRGKYVYKMLEPRHLEQDVSRRLACFSGISTLEATVVKILDDQSQVKVSTDKGVFIGKKVFNSIGRLNPPTKKSPLLLQHFVGWTIETTEPAFASETVTFMDFSIEQKSGTRFVYLLPFSETRALVEYTLFSPALLPESEYESGIADYLRSKRIGDFKIVGREKGVIPMTSHPFWKSNSKNVLHIGTAGGWTKPSTGYTLLHAEKMAARVPHFLSKGNGDFSEFHKAGRFAFYDEVFVSVLYHQNHLGRHIFSTLFRRARPDLLLKFLREETTPAEDLKILASCPKRLFIKHLVRRFISKSQSVKKV